MKIPDLYHKSSVLQRRDSKCVMNQYSEKIMWRHDGYDSLIDVGSGTGDVLIDIVYPLMPANYHRIVCSDRNPQMVSYAKNRYGHIDRSEFKVLDIISEEELPADLYAQFDHVTSYFVMMWFQNQSRALENIFKLLRAEGGDCLLTFLASHPAYDAYKLCSQMAKWSKYMQDVDKVTAPLQYSKDPAKEYTRLMTEAGFCNCNIEVMPVVFVYKNMKEFKANMKAVNPFIHRMPSELRDDFISDVIAMICQYLNLKMDVNHYDSEVPIPYKLMVVYGRKPSVLDP